MTAIKVDIKKEDKRVVSIYKLSELMKSVEYNEENRPIINQLYDILAELQLQDKKRSHGKLPAHMRIKENEDADKAIYMPECSQQDYSIQEGEKR